MAGSLSRLTLSPASELQTSLLFPAAHGPAAHSGEVASVRPASGQRGRWPSSCEPSLLSLSLGRLWTGLQMRVRAGGKGRTKVTRALPTAGVTEQLHPGELASEEAPAEGRVPGGSITPTYPGPASRSAHGWRQGPEQAGQGRVAGWTSAGSRGARSETQVPRVASTRLPPKAPLMDALG